MKKTPKYRRMTWTDRLIIERLYNSGASYRSIASMTGFAVSSVHVEIKHGLYPHLGAETTRRPLRYSARIAQDHADFQATIKGPALKLGHNHDYVGYIADQIKASRSPDQIAGTLKKSGQWTVSTTILYRYIDRGYIPDITNRNLREKPLRKRPYRHVEAQRPPKGTSIERRPSIVPARSTFGHWELDSVIGKAKGTCQSLLVLTERMTRYEIILRVPNKTSAATVAALDRLLNKFPQNVFQTITVDNGSEFQNCHGMEYDKNGAKRLSVYYCHPHTSCERGSNERSNRIVRRFFPKGRSMRKVTQADCDHAAAQVNDMPRKILGYATARELFEKELAKLLSLHA